MARITLQYWVYGDDVEMVSAVEVENTGTVAFLREAIMADRPNDFRNVDSVDIDVYLFCLKENNPEDVLGAWSPGDLDASGVNTRQLRATAKLSTFSLSDDDVFIVVGPPSIRCLLRGDAFSSVFPVNISSTQLVGDLRKLIKDEIPVALRDACIMDFGLYKGPTVPQGQDYSIEDVLGDCTMSSFGESLKNLQKLSAVFPKEIQPLVIIEHTVAVMCWIRGANPNDYFRVRISATADVNDLKSAMKAAYEGFKGYNPECLKLYKIASGNGHELEEVLDKAGEGQLLLGMESLHDIFSDILLSQSPRIVIERVEIGGSVAHVQAKPDIMNVVIESYKRAILVPSATPSQAAKSSEYKKIQASPNRIFDGRCAAEKIMDTVTPPIQLFNPAFAYFSSKAFDTGYEVPDDFFPRVLDLMHRFSLVYGCKKVRRESLTSALGKVIGHPLMEAGTINGASPDFVGTSPVHELLAYLIIGEEKNELWDAGSDPSTQVGFSFQRILTNKRNTGILERCCCPTFLVAHAGPWLTIMGGIITGNCIVQRLTDYLWIPAHSTHDEDQYRRIARVFYALRESIRRLASWYETVIDDVVPFKLDPPPGGLHPRFFLSPDRYRGGDTVVKFTYQKPLEENISTCVTYLATIDGTEQEIVVKFVASYGVEVHRTMAEAGFAPQLLYYGPINVTEDMPSYGNLRMVVMEYVEGLAVEDAQKKPEILSSFRTNIRQALELLHDAGYVFGDLRQQNVIITPEGEAKLIDFDWAGREGQVNYPLTISSLIEWPEGVQGLGLIEKEHDLVMLESLLSPL